MAVELVSLVYLSIVLLQHHAKRFMAVKEIVQLYFLSFFRLKMYFKMRLSSGMTIGVVKCDFLYKIVVLIRKDPSPGNIPWILNILLYC